MSEQLRESLSAALDDEADAFELRRIIDEASNDPEMRELWHRQHVLRDVLRGQLQQHPSELRERIQHALRAEPDTAADDEADPAGHLQLAATSPEPKPRQTNWAGRLTGTAVAASVAALVVWSAGIFDTQPELPGGVGNGLDTAQISSQAPLVTTSKITEQDRLRMDALRMQHLQWNALNNRRSVDFIRIATFQRTPLAAAAADERSPRAPEAEEQVDARQ